MKDPELLSIPLPSAVRLLVVDDQPEVNTALQQYFGMQGHTVDTAPDGAEALNMIRRSVYDVIILDVLMPNMDGIELCLRVKSDPETASTGIIILTAVADLEFRLKALKSGVDDYLTKPFSFQELGIRVMLQARTTAQRRAARTALAREQHKNNNLEIVAEMAHQITALSDDDLSQICHRTAAAMAERFGYEIVSVFLMDQAAQEAVLYATGGEFAHSTAIGYRIPVQSGIVGYVCRSGQSHFTNDVHTDPYWMTNPLDPEVWRRIRSALSVPIMTTQEVLGCILIESITPEAFEAGDRLMVETLAGYLAVAFTNSRLYRETVARTTELGVHTEILGALNATRDLQALFHTIDEQIGRIIPHTNMGISRYDAHNRLITFLYVARPGDTIRSGAQFTPEAMPIHERVAQEGKPFVMDDVLALPHVIPEQQAYFREMGLRASLIIPIQYREELIGLLVIASDKTGVYGRQDVERLQQLTPHIALAIKQAEEYEALEQAYADLQKAQESILQAEREKVALDTALQAGLTLSHEINNPLTAIIGFAELLSREHPAHPEFRIILEAGQRIAEVVRRLRQLKAIHLKSYVTDIPTQMIDLGLSEPSSNLADKIKPTG
jgi:CheY-like chemotaxis protein